MVIGIPSGVTEVEKRAVQDAAVQAGGSQGGHVVAGTALHEVLHAHARAGPQPVDARDDDGRLGHLAFGGGGGVALGPVVVTVVQEVGRDALGLAALHRQVQLAFERACKLAHHLARAEGAQLVCGGGRSKHMDKGWVRVLMKPGLLLQKLTTRQPTLDQVEVAVASLRAVLTAEQLASGLSGAIVVENATDDVLPWKPHDSANSLRRTR